MSTQGTTAQEAFDHLKPSEWAETSIEKRLELLKKIQDNMEKYGDELAEADGKMKNGIIGDELYFHGFNIFGTLGPISGAVGASVMLYELLKKGKMPQPNKVTQINDEIFDIEVFPHTAKDKVMAGKQRGHLRVKGEPKQINPMDKPSGVIAVLGAGNYSSSLEMVKAMFWENKAVIHKPHHLNEASDAVWQKIFAPLVEIGALSFCSADQGRDLTGIQGLHAIYFTGGASTAKTIMENTDTPLVSECGGNNPCIVVPGDRPWTEKEMEHQAIKIASLAKMNGGAVCGRAQTLITSKNWEQREEFLDALRKAIAEQTVSGGTYYPGTDETRKGFEEAYPDAENIQSEGGKYKKSDMLFITGAEEDSYAAKNEAFCQIISEIPLDVPANAEEFLPKAVAFSNEKLLGTLGCMILIDDDTQAAHQKSLDDAVTNLSYGGISVNTIPPMVFFSPYLTWGGNEEGREFASGVGNFGNALNFENIEKSILYDQFISPGDMLVTDREVMNKLATAQIKYFVHPTWCNLVKLIVKAMTTSAKN